MQLEDSPRFFIVDIRDVLNGFATRRQMFPVYKRFPLQDMITCVLSVNAFSDSDEVFWNELECRYSHDDSAEVLNYDTIAMFYELLCSYVDEYIRLKVPPSIDTCEYVFDRWLGYSSIIMQRDDNARACNRSLSPEYGQYRYIHPSSAF